jgi:hypothetical protein
VSADPARPRTPLRGLIEALADPRFEAFHDDVAALLALPQPKRFLAVLELYRGLIGLEPEHEQRVLYAELWELLRFGKALGSAPGP